MKYKKKIINGNIGEKQKMKKFDKCVDCLSMFDNETIKNISPRWCSGFILFLSETDRKRQEKEENN